MASIVPLERMLSAAVLLVLGASAALAQYVPHFVSGGFNVSVLPSNDSTQSTVRLTSIQLTSPGDQFELTMIIDGVGRDTGFKYCWAEVHDTYSGKNLTWRAPCDPFKVDFCSLVLTHDGDFQVLVSTSTTNDTAEFSSNTSGKGVVEVLLTDDHGDLLLVNASYFAVWQSSDHIQCRDAFSPYGGSHRTGLGWFNLACYLSLSAVMVVFSF